MKKLDVTTTTYQVSSDIIEKFFESSGTDKEAFGSDFRVDIVDDNVSFGAYLYENTQSVKMFMFGLNKEDCDKEEHFLLFVENELRIGSYMADYHSELS